MTLILTELSPFGIAMAADSAITVTNRQTGMIYAVPNAALKLQKIDYLKAGISCWGLGKIGNLETDKWLSDFISSNSSSSLRDFADALALQLNTDLPSNTTNKLGFHLAGFETYNNKPTPSFYHIHNDESPQFNANHDVSPARAGEIFNEGRVYITRNGDYQVYAAIFGQLEHLFQELQKGGIIIPHSFDLSNRVEYIVFQIRTISEIYKLSNLLPGIGGRINYLTINQDGFHSEGIKYF